MSSPVNVVSVPAENGDTHKHREKTGTWQRFLPSYIELAVYFTFCSVYPHLFGSSYSFKSALETNEERAVSFSFIQMEREGMDVNLHRSTMTEFYVPSAS